MKIVHCKDCECSDENDSILITVDNMWFYKSFVNAVNLSFKIVVIYTLVEILVNNV